MEKYMHINTSQVEAVLMDKTVSAYRLAKEIGIQESAISRLRNGKKDFTKLSLEFVMRVQAWIDKNSKQRRDTYLNKSRATSTKFIRNRKNSE